jgi:medium-chain acyl-[acyl-carrier-protein] hydrolase
MLQPTGVEVRAVQYPGREARFSEAPITDALAMAQTLAGHWAEIAGQGPVALFGHSMGALLGFELVAELERRGEAGRVHCFFASGHQAPHLPYRAPQVHKLPDAEFLPTVNAHFGGIPAELMNDPDVAEMIRTTLRADFTLVETYVPHHGTISAPIVAMGGTEDEWTTNEELDAWAEHTRGTFRVRRYPGGHFYLQPERAKVVSDIAAALA